MIDELPDDIDAELWFPCHHNAEERDYLHNARWHTFPGRMPAYCPSRRVHYRVSRSELPTDLPVATRYWVEGFLVGNMPRQPDVDDENDPEMVRWRVAGKRYFDSGAWPREEELDEG